MLKKIMVVLPALFIAAFSSFFLLPAEGQDVSVNASDIKFTPPDSVVAGTQVVISIPVYNLKKDDTDESKDATADIKIYLDNKETKLGSWTGTIPAQSGMDLGIDWDTTAVNPGYHAVIVDIINIKPKDSNPDNNQAITNNYLIYWRR
ncbi:MAG: hypothetical protein HZA77_07235 [Candidatus Schekmanbacteria bacterium]|nr:hypothetical protein [Candidatus Schekmanbacteria bacterium]